MALMALLMYGLYRRRHAAGCADADHCLVLLLDPFDRQSALAPIAPFFVAERWQPALGADLADALEVFRQHILLDLDLSPGGQMLERASTANAEMRTTRLDAIRRGLDDLQCLRFVEMPRAGGLLHADRFTRQRAGDEHGLAGIRMTFGPTRDAAAIQAEIDDGNGLGGLV